MKIHIGAYNFDLVHKTHLLKKEKKNGMGSKITGFETTSFMGGPPAQKYMFAGKVIRFPLYEVNKAARYTMSVGLLY